jgi:hypothetical protein
MLKHIGNAAAIAAFYVIDKHSKVAYTHSGEGEIARTEAAIRNLLAQK